MNSFDAESFVGALIIIGFVIVVSALLSGLVERSGLPQIAVFLALGAAIGPAGLGMLNIALDSPELRVVATLSLALVLFTDAVGLNIAEVRRHGTLALRLLGPGSLLCAALIALAGWWLLDLPAAAAAILGAALASTDPVLLRGLLRRRDIPVSARQGLQLESGLNDVVLLPILIVAMAFLNREDPLTGAGWAKLVLNLFILGPGAGVIVGLLGVAALELVRKKLGVRRDYESLYSLGLGFTAFAAAEMVHGSGFLAAFAAGMTIAALDVELCDCFVEYGAATAEMLLLFTFVLLGTSLIWSGLSHITGATLLFTALAVLVRTPVYLASLLGSGVEARSRRLIAWFGPRGLSSLLLVLLPVFAGLPGAGRLFAICSLVVLVSVVLHGGSPLLLARSARKRALQETGDAVVPAAPIVNQPVLACPAADTSEIASRPAGPPGDAEEIGRQQISIDELRRLWQAKVPVTILDVRTERSLEGSDLQARGAIRMPPDNVADQARDLRLNREDWLVAYCA
jgi:NhaP-type Na+/H+ or K+/H+ antiporter